ncbi:hypothetical protein [Aureispira sp. CCB-E]|uniref:hypothetical protein n=1 Tax=Aureispira sp. CCB-E TaxID=3051121 RepID=UPI002869422C|nr:hypothetical protein [Aureispira sp. CCB-E]WMX13346.1 hypothetical protein QP953_21100 [Aureispira sp. CCB-E]
MTTVLPSETTTHTPISIWTIRIITLAFFAQMLLSTNLWFPYDRSYPTIPLLPFLSFSFGATLTPLLSGLFLGCFSWASCSPKWREQALWIGIISLFLLILEDINRFQAWVYIYTTLLSIVGWNWRKKQPQQLRLSLQFTMAMVYFWTGAQKLNIQFITDVYPWLVKVFEATKWLAEYPNLGYGVGLFEILLGITLLIPKTQKIGVLLGTGLHLGILILLISDEWNSVVYPWNVAMIALLFTLFWKKENDDLPSSESLPMRPNLGIIILFGVLPFFDFFQLIPHCLALGMYSGTSMECDLILDDNGRANCVPPKLHEKLLYQSDTQSILSLDDWGVEDLNIPPFASERVYRAVAKEFCQCSHSYQGYAEFYYPERWKDEDRQLVVSCQELLQED